jgi:DNA primase
MSRIKDSSVEAVKSAAEILPLVEDYVRLRKAGGTYKVLCPFHQERTPSFTVTPARGTFKCFGCGEGGDAIAFVMKRDNIDFVDAIELLARRFGVELE